MIIFEYFLNFGKLKIGQLHGKQANPLITIAKPYFLY